MKKFIRVMGVALILILPMLGCKEKEKIDQGRVIQFDKSKGVLQVILNKSSDHLSPDYSALPPVSYKLPSDLQDIGFIPKAGLRIKLDAEKNEIIIFDEATQGFKILKYTPVDRKDNVAKDNPLVLENGQPKKFPAVDKEKNIFTIYSERQNILTTFSLPPEYSALPVFTWDAGDEVLVHYQGDGPDRKVTKIVQIGFRGK
jgi:hypothetical protein